MENQDPNIMSQYPRGPQPPRRSGNSNSVMITVIICATVVVLAVLIAMFVFFINKKETSEQQTQATAAVEAPAAQSTVTDLNVPEGDVKPAKKTGSLKNVGWTNDYSDIVCYQYLDDSDVAHLSGSQLRILRNTIYARHGRKFASKDLRNYFSGFSWYSPRYDEISPSSLSAVEKHNIALIQRYE